MVFGFVEPWKPILAQLGQDCPCSFTRASKGDLCLLLSGTDTLFSGSER